MVVPGNTAGDTVVRYICGQRLSRVRVSQTVSGR